MPPPFFEHPSIIAPADSSDPDPESSGSSSVEGSGSESEDGAPTPKAGAMQVDGAASLVPETRSPVGSSQTLPTNKTSDDSDSGPRGDRCHPMILALRPTPIQIPKVLLTQGKK